ncbi:MAG: MarR family transcriptional regulator [Lysobacter sp.]|jgi:DNA-binding MarR family transcriptional regulator|nr:MarR family transcriptional regulator [Lysobacter sp.]MDQ3269329.1 MarR family transcriptional regulator [Pseudomonadota bacterium]
MSTEQIGQAGDAGPRSSDAQGRFQMDLHQHLPYRLAHLSNLLRRATSDCYVRGMKISAREWRVLGMLGLKGPLTPTQLAELTAMDRATITRAGDRLEKLGYCRRIPNEQDNRSFLMTLSPEGDRQCAAIIPKMARSGERCRSVFSAGEQALLLELLDRLQAALDDGLLSE